MHTRVGVGSRRGQAKKIKDLASQFRQIRSKAHQDCADSLEEILK